MKSTILTTTIRTARIFAVALTLAGASTIGADAAILDVDCAGGGFSLDIQTAVTAAGPGDTVVVHECATAYDPFVVSGKDRVHVVAADIATTDNMGAQRVGVATLPLSVFTPTVEVSGTAGTAACVLVEGSFAVEIKGFLLTSCISNGIEIFSSEHTKIVDNRIEGVMAAGIFDAGTYATTITGNTIIFALREGIFLEQTTLGLVQDNLIGGNGSDGIFISGTDVHIVNNEVRINAGPGIHDVFGFMSRIERNTALANGGAGNIHIDAGSFDADVVGNETGASLVLAGVGTEVFDNS